MAEDIAIKVVSEARHSIRRCNSRQV